MPAQVILASGSDIRGTLLRRAGVAFTVEVAKVDEAAIRESLVAGGASPRDVADALAEAKTVRVSSRHGSSLTIGADQVAELDGEILAKTDSPEEARDQIAHLAGTRHRLHSAAVIAEEGRPVWRQVSSVTLEMRPLSPAFIDAYVARNWPGIGHSVGGYKIEEEGARLFTRIDGDYFAVLGLPLLEVLSYLTLRGVLET